MLSSHASHRSFLLSFEVCLRCRAQVKAKRKGRSTQLNWHLHFTFSLLQPSPPRLYNIIIKKRETWYNFIGFFYSMPRWKIIGPVYFPRQAIVKGKCWLQGWCSLRFENVRAFNNITFRSGFSRGSWKKILNNERFNKTGYVLCRIFFSLWKIYPWVLFSFSAF